MHWRLLVSIVAGALALALAGCGSPDTDTGQVCGPNGECPLGFACDPRSRRCVMSGTTGGDGGPGDAATRDASPADATSAALDTTFSSMPPSLSGPTASFSFTSNAAGATFECSLDGAAFSACSSPQQLTSLTDGSHTFAVRAVSGAQRDTSPASYTWTVSTTAPITTITEKPPALTNATSARFVFSATPAGSTTECSREGAAFASCTSPQSLSSLAPGVHRFSVRATAPNGVKEANPPEVQWTIDVTGPTVTITSPAPGASTGTTFTLAFTAMESVTRFECALDAGSFSSCGSGTSGTKDLTVGTAGAHTASVQAVDAAGNTGPKATVSFTVDIVGPTFTIGLISAPRDTGNVTVNYTSSEPTATRTCALDGVACATCGATAAGCAEASAGEHVFTIQGTDLAGNAGPTATSSTIGVVYGPNAGHAILIGHDFLTSSASTEALLVRAFEQAPYLARGLFDRKLRVAIFSGASVVADELAGARAAVDPIIESATVFRNPAELATALRGNDVLLVVDQQNPTGADAIGTSWGPTLKTFLDRGGVVVVLDGMVDGSDTPSRTFAVLGGGILQIAGSANLGDTDAVRVVDSNDLLHPDDISPLAGESSYPPTSTSVLFSLDAKETGTPRPIYAPAASFCTSRVCNNWTVLDKIFPVYTLVMALGTFVPPSAPIPLDIDVGTDYSRIDCAVTALRCNRTGTAPPCECETGSTCACAGTFSEGFSVPFVTSGTYRVDVRVVDRYGLPGRGVSSSAIIDVPSLVLTPSSFPDGTWNFLLCYRGVIADSRALSYAITFNGAAVSPDAQKSAKCAASDTGSFTGQAVCNNVFGNPPQNTIVVDVRDAAGNAGSASMSWVLGCIL